MSPKQIVTVEVEAENAAEAAAQVGWALYHHDGTPEWMITRAEPKKEIGS